MPPITAKRTLRAAAGRIRRAIIYSAPNLILRRQKDLVPLSFTSFGQLPSISTGQVHITEEEHAEFLRDYFPDWNRSFRNPFYKKLLELHASWRILQTKEEDTYLDLAGGMYTYVGRINAHRRLLNDRYVSPLLKTAMRGSGVEFIESPAERMPLSDMSVDKISCHHSFEHFQGDADSQAIREIQRVLRPGGKACIVPLFVAHAYFEIVDLPWTRKSDAQARRVLDPTSPFPGGMFSGGFARVYDLDSLQGRVLRAIDSNKFKISLFQFESHGALLPDPKLACHRTDPVIDFPFRAFVIERFSP
jgi:SAM-dependent methyltransferase